MPAAAQRSSALPSGAPETPIAPSISPFTTMEGEAAIGLHFFMLAATWSLPLFIHDLWALARERQLAPVVWTESRLTGFRLAGVQAAGVGLLASLTLVLRSTTSLDFIYFAF